MASISVSVVLVLTVMVACFTSAGAMGEIVVIMTQDYDDHHTDRQMRDISLHIFENGLRVDPENLHARYFKGDDIEVQREKKGEYHGRADSHKSDFIDVSMNTTDPVRLENNQVRGKHVRLTLEVVGKSLVDRVQSGEDVEFVVRTFGIDGEPEDPEVVALTSEDIMDDDEKELELKKYSEGVYKTTLRIPSDKESKTYQITARAKMNGDYNFEWTCIKTEHYQIYFDDLKFDGKVVAMDLIGTDLDGDAIADAVFNVDYSYEPVIGATVDGHGGQKRTGKDGRVEYRIGAAGLRDDIHISGTMTATGKVQHFSYTFEVLEHPPTDREEWVKDADFIVLPDEGALLSQGTWSKVGFRAYGSLGENKVTEPLSKMELVYYIYTTWELVATGTAETDKNGEFILDVKAPDDGPITDRVTFNFHILNEEGTWLSDEQDLISSRGALPDALADIESLRNEDILIDVKGPDEDHVLQISTDYPLDPTLTNFASISPGKLDLRDYFGLDVNGSGSITGDCVCYLKKVGTSWRCDYKLPEFMRQDDLTVFIMSTAISYNLFPSLDLYSNMRTNYVHVILKRDDGGSWTSGWALPDAESFEGRILIVIGATGATVTVAGVYMIRSGRGAATPERPKGTVPKGPKHARADDRSRPPVRKAPERPLGSKVQGSDDKGLVNSRPVPEKGPPETGPKAEPAGSIAGKAVSMDEWPKMPDP